MTFKEVAAKRGVSVHALYEWKKAYKKNSQLPAFFELDLPEKEVKQSFDQYFGVSA